MRKFITGICGLLAMHAAVFAQAVANADLAAAAAAVPVREVLDTDEGVAFVVREDGTYLVLAQGVGEWDFEEGAELKSAQRAGIWRARTKLAKFLREKAVVTDGWKAVAAKSRTPGADGSFTTVPIAEAQAKLVADSMRARIEAILAGVAPLSSQKRVTDYGGEVRVVVGIGSAALREARKSRSAPTLPVRPRTLSNNTDF